MPSGRGLFTIEVYSRIGKASVRLLQYTMLKIFFSLKQYHAEHFHTLQFRTQPLVCWDVCECCRFCTLPEMCETGQVFVRQAWSFNAVSLYGVVKLDEIGHSFPR